MESGGKEFLLSKFILPTPWNTTSCLIFSYFNLYTNIGRKIFDFDLRGRERSNWNLELNSYFFKKNSWFFFINKSFHLVKTEKSERQMFTLVKEGETMIKRRFWWVWWDKTIRLTFLNTQFKVKSDSILDEIRLRLKKVPENIKQLSFYKQWINNDTFLKFIIINNYILLRPN